MSQANVAVPPVAPTAAAPAPAPAAAPAVPVAAPAAAPVAVPPVAAPPAELPPVPAGAENWLKPRLQQAESSGATKKEKELLASLGVKDPAEAKALLDKARAADEANKTEIQRAKDEAASFKTKAARADELEVAVKAQSDEQLASLTDAQRATVADVIGDDPATILKKLPKLKASWAVPTAPATAGAPAAPAATPAPAAAPVPIPAPATTSPPPNAPGGASTTTPPDHKAEYARLKASNPHAAALYLQQHADKIYPRQQ